MPLSKSFKKDAVKNIAKSESKSDFNYDGNYKFYEFYKGYDEFEEMLLDSKYKKMKNLQTFLLNLKLLSRKKNRNATQKGAN